MVGLVTDPATITQQVQSFTAGLPPESQKLITDQLTAVAGAGNGSLTLALVISLLVALWSASSGTTNLVRAVSLAYDEPETRASSSCAEPACC